MLCIVAIQNTKLIVTAMHMLPCNYSYHHTLRGVAKGGPGWAFALPTNLPVTHSSAIIFALLARLVHGGVATKLLTSYMSTCTVLVPF